jgi:hypothetical protein
MAGFTQFSNRFSQTAKIPQIPQFFFIRQYQAIWPIGRRVLSNRRMKNINGALTGFRAPRRERQMSELLSMRFYERTHR